MDNLDDNEVLELKKHQEDLHLNAVLNDIVMVTSERDISEEKNAKRYEL